MVAQGVHMCSWGMGLRSVENSLAPRPRIWGWERDLGHSNMIHFLPASFPQLQFPDFIHYSVLAYLLSRCLTVALAWVVNVAGAPE